MIDWDKIGIIISVIAIAINIFVILWITVLEDAIGTYRDSRYYKRPRSMAGFLSLGKCSNDLNFFWIFPRKNE